jgi:tripartite-type tricarboxylate transporter receptor subunit TctC
MTLQRRDFLAALATTGLAPAAWAAADYPTKPVSMIVPWPVGGPSDFYARLYQEPFQRRLKQPLLVENVVGVSGALGVRRVLDAPADGHTLGLFGTAEMILAPLGLSAVRHRATDLRVAAFTVSSALVLVTRADLPLATLQDLLKGASAGTFTLGHTGNGSLFHLAGERLAQITGLKLNGVPYKGIAPIVTDLAGGHVDMALLPVAGQLVGLIRQGKLRPVAHASREPIRQMLELPAFSSLPQFKDFVFNIWASIAVRRDMPESLVAQINRITYELTSEPVVQRATAETGGAVAPPRSLAEVEQTYQAEIVRYQSIAQSIGLQPQ